MRRCLSERAAPLFSFDRWSFVWASRSAREAAKCLADMKACWAGWEVLREQTSTRCKKIVKMSVLRQTFVAEVFEALAAVGFASVPDEVQVFLRRVFSNFGSTKMVEDSGPEKPTNM